MKTRFIVVGIFICCLLSASMANAWPWSKGGIKVIVSNDETSKPIPDVKVTVDETGESSKTDEFGEFIFKDMKPGDYNFSFKKIGFTPKTIQITVESGKINPIKVNIRKSKDIYNLSAWTEKAAERISEIMIENGYKNRKIAIAFYKKTPSEDAIPLPALILRFTTSFNKLAKNGNEIVIRSSEDAGFILKELKEQQQFKVDFDPSTIQNIYSKLGANVFIIGALLENREYYEPQVNGTSIEKQAYIPRLSINDILLQRFENE
ncbi:MAG: carboxypeptidase-like regulatory domain-containing protein [Desulfobacterales bacterium]|nr:carboxypeptidase-like regulatory domain-containing protein [Desulfobacterales bacterium]